MISFLIRQRILRRDSFTCQLCGATRHDGAKLQIDHKNPKSKGGADSEDNLWTLCWPCNIGKGNRWVDDEKPEFHILYLHQFIDGKICKQGRHVGFLEPPQAGMALFIIELFDWFDGSPNGKILVPMEEIVGDEPRWQFYNSAQEMRDAFEATR